MPYLAEAIRMLERGGATAKDIDTAMKLGAGESFLLVPIRINAIPYAWLTNSE